MRKLLLLITALAVVGCSCQGEPDKSPGTSKPHVRISVLQSGKILIDGTESTIAEVEQRLAQLKSEGGLVSYYREAGQQEPPPEAMQVIKLVTDNALPITLSSKPDFSDYIGEDGQ
jgi:hypothetical protein